MSIDKEDNPEIILEVSRYNEESTDVSDFTDKLDLPIVDDLFQLCKIARGSPKNVCVVVYAFTLLGPQVDTNG